MKYFEGIAGAEAYAINSSKKHQDYRYVAKSKLINVGVVYYVYNSLEDIEEGEKIISSFYNGLRCN